MRPDDQCGLCSTRPKIHIMPSHGRKPVVSLCAYCDMGNGQPQAGPPVMIEYIKKGHQ